ncbi:MAG: hypothetical protein WBI27_07255 [Thermoanaerobaculia bacterium]
MIRATKRFNGVVAATLLLAAVTGCSSYALWPRTDEFLSRLECGMSAEQVASVVDESPGLEFTDSGRGAPWDKVARKNGTSIALDFNESGLRQAEVIWIDAILSAKALPIHDFCTDSG